MDPDPFMDKKCNMFFIFKKITHVTVKYRILLRLLNKVRMQIGNIHSLCSFNRSGHFSVVVCVCVFYILSSSFCSIIQRYLDPSSGYYFPHSCSLYLQLFFLKNPTNHVMFSVSYKSLQPNNCIWETYYLLCWSFSHIKWSRQLRRATFSQRSFSAKLLFLDPSLNFLKNLLFI